MMGGWRHVRSRHGSISLDNKDRLIVNAIFLADLPKMMVLFEGVFHQSVADVFCWLPVVFAHYPFKLLAFVIVAAVVDPVGVEEENVSRAHQRDLCNIRGLRPLPEFQ